MSQLDKSLLKTTGTKQAIMQAPEGRDMLKKENLAAFEARSQETKEKPGNQTSHKKDARFYAFKKAKAKTCPGDKTMLGK
ncbi:MAG: hypothetical protein LBU69_06210 [Deltaproteobacteria bacterium]|jgi:hypothetical protein|nr:hypothetical protein [Deltaproteobacteria bacterium]